MFLPLVIVVESLSSQHTVTEGQATIFMLVTMLLSQVSLEDFILYTVNGKEYIGRVIADE